MPILAPLYHDLIAISRPSTEIWNFRMRLPPSTVEFSIFTSVHTNSSGDEVMQPPLLIEKFTLSINQAWHVIFMSLWKDFGGRFDCIISSLKKQTDFLDREAISFDIIEAKESRIRIQDEIQHRQKREMEIIQENEKQMKIAQLRHVIAWLSSDERLQETEYERITERRHDNTCKWMVNDPLFKSWIKDDAKDSCLWLNGKPGSGRLHSRCLYNNC